MPHKERVDFRSEEQKQVDAMVAAIEQRSKKSGQTFSIKKPNYTEKWMYSMLGDNLDFLEISYFQGNTKYSETYYVQSGQLIYATEREVQYWSKDDYSRWTAFYRFKDGKLASYVTSGLGKAEDESQNWEPDPVSVFRARLKTWKKKLKRAAARTEEEARKSSNNRRAVALGRLNVASI